MANLFGNDLTAVSTDNGAILDNIAKQAVVTESVLTLMADDTVTAVHISPYGKNLLNTTSLNTLRTAILSDNEEAIAYSGGYNLQEINFHTYAQGQTAGASNLKLQITGTETIVKNALLVDNIKDLAGNSAIKSTTATNTSFTKQTNTFQFDNNPSTGYISIHNSNSSQSGYIQWYSYSNVGLGSYPRNAYMGLSSHAGGLGDDLKLSLENGCNFNILKDATI